MAELPVTTRFALGATITREQQTFLDRHGFLHFSRVAAPDEVAMLIAEFDDLQRRWFAERRTHVFGIPLFFGRDA